MSTTVDQRVVQMRFDNKQFESGVSDTMSTLSKLKQALNFTGASKSLEGINGAAKGVNLSCISNGVEAVSARFSALQVMGVTALANITNSAVNTGKRIAKALTVDPIKTGFQEYETQINAVQTILANTESKGTTLKDVNGALDELNKYADKTIYNFTEMTKNIGTFTAAGVDLDTSVSSIQGIANLAAVSGSTSQQASTAMYQLSQALAAGKVSLMDWNSVVNAGMGGQVFQDALKRTATAMGKDVDGLIKKYGSFRESLTQGEWLTTDVLTATLEQFTMAAEEGSKEWEKYKKSLMDDGYTEKQATEILKMANTATDAATKVKTFSQLIDTAKESVQSGWTQTWEILVGDFEEAKKTLTSVSDAFNSIVEKSAKTRNELLQGWKDLGGRTALLKSFKNIFEGLGNIAKPIGEAFREIFPALKPKQLMDVTKNFKKLTESFKEFTGSHGDQIKSTFKGIFSVLDIGLTIVKAVAKGFVKVIKSFSGIGGGILDATGSIGGWLSGLRDTVKEADIFGKAMDFVSNALSTVITKIKELGGSIGSGLSKALDTIGEFINNLDFSGFDFSGLLNFANGGLLTAFLFGLQKLTGSLTGTSDSLKEIFEKFDLKKLFGDKLDGVTDILDNVRGCFQAYQSQLQAGTLIKIATAIAILAASLAVISAIDGDALNKALGGISVLFAELMLSSNAFSNFNTKSLTGVAKSVGTMIGISTSILILSLALKSLSSIEPKDLIGGVAAVGVLMGEIALFTSNAKIDKSLKKSSGSLILLSTAMVIMAQAVKQFSSMDVKEIGVGLLGVGGSLAVIAAGLKFMPKNTISIGAGLVIVSGAMLVLAKALDSFGGMDGEKIKIGLQAMGGALGELAIALFLMKSSVSGAAALLIAAGAMAILTPVLKSLGDLSIEQIAKALGVMAGTFVILGIAGATLGPVIPVLLGLAGAIALFGAGCLAVGVGVSAFAAGLAMLAVSGTAGIASITLIIQGIIGLIPAAAKALALGVVSIIQTIASSAGQIAESLLGMITAILTAFEQHLPKIVDLGCSIVVKLLEGITKHLPELVSSAVKLVITFIESVATALTNHGPELANAVVKLIKSIVTTLVHILTDSIPKLVTTGIDLIKGLIKGIKNTVGSVTKAIVNVGKSIVNAIKNFFGIHSPSTVFRDIGKDVIQGLINGFKNKLNSAITTIKNIGKNCVNAIKNKVSDFKEAGAKIMNSGFIQGVKNKISNAVDTVKGIPTKCATAIKNKASEFKSAGKNVIDGFIEGLKSKITAAANWAGNLGSRVITAAKNALGIASPSKEFKSLAEWSVEGFVAGIKKYSNNAIDSTSGMAESILESAKNPMKALSDVINGNVDLDPTIRPVLDLSNVRSGAASISSLLSSGVSLGTLSGISSSVNRRNQNGGNGDVVSAINRLRKDIGNVGGISYNINGITYDDGSNVSNAVKDLIRATRIGGRV